MRKAHRLIAILSLLLTGASKSALAEEFRIPVYDGDDSFVIQVLHLALKAEGGDHSIETFEHPVTQSRTLREMQSGKFNIFYSGYSRERERDFTQVNIPLSRGLLGYRFLAIQAENDSIFTTVHTFADFQRLVTLGSNNSWPDADIMRNAGLEVVSAPSEALWGMLKRGRFLAFPRGMNEAMPEIAREGADKATPLILEPNYMLAYKYDTFFYVPREKHHLAAIVERGLRAAYDNGTYIKLFNSHPVIKAAFLELKAHPRTIFWIDTPNMSERTKNIPDEYWLQPSESNNMTMASKQ
ncbi:hypothetical protein [Kordiimonas aestuarii]|uniref:hypothetical protein n=1 Tax=Kordiimonas aestuarii TaxID=1005925 RepID=UPI0021D0B87A|nr:hypothetical protein [Kordiimonas aestuarii]